MKDPFNFNFQATSENPGLCVTLPRQNAHLPFVNSAFVSVASHDSKVFGGCLNKEAGIALMLTMFALALASVLGLIITMNAITEVRISDNSESHTQAVLAAISGLNHARVAVHRLDFDALLKGPDGIYDTDAAYIKEAKSFGFRLPFSVLTAQTLNIEDPLADIGDAPDDGIINTGALWGVHGTALIPREGIVQWTDKPAGTGQQLLSRYFVKVTDNNGEASELAADAADNPFVDGDGIIIVRSIGIARTFAEATGGVVRRNSVAVFESRLRRATTWDLGPALNILGASVNAVFTGSPEISGETSAGIGVLNPSPDGAGFPENLLLEAFAGIITDGGLPVPSIQDITEEARNDRNKSMLFDAGGLTDFIDRRAPRMADTIYEGDRVWSESSLPFLGFYDKTVPWNDPAQKPSVVLVKGNLTATEGLTGAGVLIVTGRLECAGTLDYRGLVLVLGAGKLSLKATGGPGIAGSVVTVKLVDSGAGVTFGIPDIEIGGATRIAADKDFVRMALRLFPVEQISFREIAGSDP